MPFGTAAEPFPVRHRLPGCMSPCYLPPRLCLEFPLLLAHSVPAAGHSGQAHVGNMSYSGALARPHFHCESHDQQPEVGLVSATLTARV